VFDGFTDTVILLTPVQFANVLGAVIEIPDGSVILLKLGQPLNAYWSSPVTEFGIINGPLK